jgi:RNA polymerase sigma factor for flagellar operon FliA
MNVPIPKAKALQSYKAAGEVIDWELVRNYIPLLKSIVHRMRLYFPDHVETKDLYSMGMAGLVRAASRFDSTQSPHFGAYAAHRIKGALLDELRKMDCLNRSDRTMTKHIQQSIQSLEQALKRPPTEQEVAEDLKMELSVYQQHLDRLRPMAFISIDHSINADGEEGNAESILNDANAPDARQLCERSEVLSLLKDRLQSLEEVPKKVIVLYYYKNLKLAEIAEVLGITASRVCQIHTQAVLSLKHYFERLSHLDN